MAGADFHSVKQCKHPHFIKPALFAFFTEGSEELKEFVADNLGVPLWQDMEGFKTWLEAHPGTDAPNPVKLYWWLLKYWERL